MKPIEFWFDFSSPYAYFAALEIGDIARKHERDVLWRPILLGPVFQVTGMQSLSLTPMRGDYARHDWARTARRLNVPFRVPAVHPIISTTAGRAYLWIEERDPEHAVTFGLSVFRALYADNLDVRDRKNVLALAEQCGVADVGGLEMALPSDNLKERFRSQTCAAIARGVFGSPFFFVGSEPFWGHDRLALMDDWLASGGW
jgi:2-hydroxychromene-2-carboxylate isomerase